MGRSVVFVGGLCEACDGGGGGGWEEEAEGRVNMAFYLLLFLNKNVGLFVCSGTLRLLVVNSYTVDQNLDNHSASLAPDKNCAASEIEIGRVLAARSF